MSRGEYLLAIISQSDVYKTMYILIHEVDGPPMIE